MGHFSESGPKVVPHTSKKTLKIRWHFTCTEHGSGPILFTLGIITVFWHIMFRRRSWRMTTVFICDNIQNLKLSWQTSYSSSCFVNQTMSSHSLLIISLHSPLRCRAQPHMQNHQPPLPSHTVDLILKYSTWHRLTKMFSFRHIIIARFVIPHCSVKV